MHSCLEAYHAVSPVAKVSGPYHSPTRTGETVGHKVHVYQCATEQYLISSTGMQYILILHETGRSGITNNCLLLSKTIIHTHKNCIYTKIQFYCIYPHYRDRA